MCARCCFFLWRFLTEGPEGRGLFPFTQQGPLFLYQRAIGKGGKGGGGWDGGGGVVVYPISLEGAPSCFLTATKAEEAAPDPTGRTSSTVSVVTVRVSAGV